MKRIEYLLELTNEQLDAIEDFANELLEWQERVKNSEPHIKQMVLETIQLAEETSTNLSLANVKVMKAFFPE